MRFSAFDFDVVTSPPPDDRGDTAVTTPLHPLRVLSTLGVMGALEAQQTALERGLGTTLAVAFAPTKVLLDRLDAGETPDVVILTAEAIAALDHQGRLAPGSAPLAGSLVGIAQAPGGARPDIGSAAALVATLRAARSIAYSGAGASGLFFAALIERLGIAAEINAKATIIPQGLTGALVARGETQYAIQQISELKLVDGIDIIGPLPADTQTPTIFSAAPLAGTAQADTAAALIRLLTGPEMVAAFARAGLEPIG
ncbi:MAG: ABC transporter substrate-binding protein [Proteobacteria bacterium]|nr:ABC transporter substrate-binding protein [Pseudomonadota bacterium]